VLRGVDGGLVSYQFGTEYTLDFTVRTTGSGNELLLSPFILSRIYRAGERSPVLTRPLYRATMPVTLSQTLVVGASKEEKSKSALILILHAQELPRGDGEKGVPGPVAAEKK
jgi:hypothetical protein